MAKARRPGHDKRAAVKAARISTDEKLERERLEADQAIEAKAAAARREAEEALQRTQREVNRTIDATAKEALRAAAKPTVRSSVAKVAERAKEEIAVERKSVKQATESEREERKRAFLDIMVQERLETDEALGLERSSSDRLVASRDEILAMISHDLKNLIQAMQLKAVTLGRMLSVGEPGPARQLAEEIGASCKIIGRWAGDLVDISGLNTGVLGLVVGNFLPAEIVNEPVHAFLPKAHQKGIELSVHVDAPDRSVRCDRGRVVQVLMNLLDNAIKFTPRAGAVTVRAEAREREVRLSVHDTGPGIPEEDHENVFERRWRAAARTGGGAGLGLYIARRVIDALGGRIWVESSPGRGSTFFITLPDE